MYPEINSNTQLFIVHMDYKLNETKKWLQRWGIATNVDNGSIIASMELEIETKPIDVNNKKLEQCLVVDIPSDDSNITRALIPPVILSQILQPDKTYINNAGYRTTSSWLNSYKFEKLYRVVRVFPNTISFEFP